MIDRALLLLIRRNSLLAKWMLHHGRQNLMYDLWDDICDIMREYDVTFSIGDGLRPGGLADATDDELDRQIADKRIYPAVDPLDSTSRMLDPSVVG